MVPLPFRPDAELRILEERYAPEMYPVIDANRERLRLWLPWVDHTRGVGDVLVFIRSSLTQFAANQGFQAGIWWRGAFSGGVGMKPINWTDSKVEIGYWLASAAEGNGLITDACRALIRHLFDELGLNRVEIRVAAANHRSLAVARRLRAVNEGTDRDGQFLHGAPHDIHRFSILRREWQ